MIELVDSLVDIFAHLWKCMHDCFIFDDRLATILLYL